jgi:acyl carrier protein
LSSNAIVEELRVFIARAFLSGKDEGLNAETPLLEWGVIDSTSILALRAFIKERLGVTIPTTELLPKNLANLRAIADLIVRLQHG